MTIRLGFAFLALCALSWMSCQDPARAPIPQDEETEEVYASP